MAIDSQMIGNPVICTHHYIALNPSIEYQCFDFTCINLTNCGHFTRVGFRFIQYSERFGAH